MTTKTVASTFGNFDEDQLKTLKGGLKELSDVFTMQESQKEVVKDIVTSLHEELKIPKKLINKLARTYHKRNYEETSHENQEFEMLYESINE